MSNFVVSARKYRPLRFEDVVGQEHVSGTLKKALQNDKLAHAFLFCGPRGVGKTTCARILAKVLNCQNVTADFEPCNECSSCQAFSQNASFNITELDAASNNSVEHIRALIEQVRFQPQQGKYKVFIIDEVHMLSQQAFNAFLKTLEEPPPYAIFILATTEKHKIIPTILSRCQIFDFRRIQVPDMVAHLEAICRQEGIEADHDALHIIAQKADGALRDALSIFDRIASFSGKAIRYQDVIENLNVLDYDYYFRTVDALLTEDMSQVMLILDDVMRKGFDADIFINGLAEHLRNLLVCKDPETLVLLEVSDTLRERYRQQAALAPHTLLLTALNIANDCDVEYRMARNKRLHVEMALIKMTFILRAADPASAPPLSTPEKKSPSHSAPLRREVSAAAERRDPVAAPRDAPAKPDAELPTAPEAAGKNAAPPPRPPSARHLLPKLDGGLDALVAELRETERANAPDTGVITLPELKKHWQKYLESCEQDSVRTVLRQTGLGLEGHTVIATVGSTLAENTLRQEQKLMETLREAFRIPNLVLSIEVDRSKQPAAPRAPKPLTDMEKLKKMHEVNALVRDVQQRFDLRFDEG